MIGGEHRRIVNGGPTYRIVAQCKPGGPAQAKAAGVVTRSCPPAYEDSHLPHIRKERECVGHPAPG